MEHEDNFHEEEELAVRDEGLETRRIERFLADEGFNTDFGDICHDLKRSNRSFIQSYDFEHEEISEIYREVISHCSRRGKSCDCLAHHFSTTPNSSHRSRDFVVEQILFTRNYMRSMRQNPDDVLRCTVKGNLLNR